MKPATGDPELAAQLDTLVGKRTRSVAAAVVEVGTETTTRFAFVDAAADTRFEIGSVTKGLTGMLLADSMERGEMSLDTEVGAILSACAGSALGSVTARELCTHTSGLPRVATDPRTMVHGVRSVLLGRDPYRGRDGAEVVTGAARERLRHRGQYHYSNLGAAVLGQLVATVVGSDYRALLRERILLRTRMTESALANADDSVPRGHSSFGRRPQPWIMDGYAPAGAVVSTITDMSHLAAALLDGSAPGCSALAPFDGIATDTPNRATGMFWIVDARPNPDDTITWHNGQTGGYSAFFALFPQSRRAVVVLANVARAAEPQRIAFGLARAPRL